ncbi:MAG: prolyl hydroxylase family protein [Gammaproteobacteria bacterium]
MTYQSSGYFAAPLNSPDAIRRHCADQPPGTLVARNALPPGLLIIKDFIPPDARQRVLDYARQSTAVPATVQDLSADSPDPRAHKSIIRVTDHIDTQGISKWLEPLLRDALLNVVAPHFRCTFSWFEPPALLRYQPGGHYVPHADSENWIAAQNQWKKAIDRDISILLYLDDKYDGGELDFPNFRFRLKPSAGMLICFPSDHRYVHCAHEVSQGERHVIVSWAAKRDTPRVNASPPQGIVRLPG